MILPTKHIRTDRALIGIGAEILRCLDRPATMSQLWNKMRSRRTLESSVPATDYRWFVLGLDLLFILGAVDLQDGIICRSSRVRGSES